MSSEPRRVSYEPVRNPVMPKRNKADTTGANPECTQWTNRVLTYKKIL